MRKVQECNEYVQFNIGKFLARKHMDFMYLPDNLFYSESRQRLIVPTLHGYSGRDLTENSHQKWLIYTDEKFVGVVQAGTTVVVEDLFSMYKVQWALRDWPDVQVVCSLGTALRPQLFLELIQKSSKVIMFYDGDKAGHNGARVEARRLNVAGITAISACAPEHCDPKDMRVHEIKQHIGEYH